ncbi:MULTISPECIES: DUF29 domain-containing protein [Cysteiniphilum]|uniref:DUF29 domain-containing protein n=1 Tax=Cysteiniphilum TaxID=2056696 RepID=UPI0017838E77|nr:MULTISPECIES: DUF29 domain-containing protein [Cysteiniphilum]
MNPNLYNTDFYVWAIETAKAIKTGRFDTVDLEHLADEVESMAKRDYRELVSRLIVLIAHLLKWQYQPTQRCSSWLGTIREQRTQIELLLADSPSLKPKLSDLLSNDKTHSDAIKIVLTDTGLQTKDLPQILPYTLDQLLDDNYLP